MKQLIRPLILEYKKWDDTRVFHVSPDATVRVALDDEGTALLVTVKGPTEYTDIRENGGVTGVVFGEVVEVDY